MNGNPSVLNSLILDFAGVAGLNLKGRTLCKSRKAMAVVCEVDLARAHLAVPKLVFVSAPAIGLRWTKAQPYDRYIRSDFERFPARVVRR